jgi:hypothetical protein
VNRRGRIAPAEYDHRAVVGWEAGEQVAVLLELQFIPLGDHAQRLGQDVDIAGRQRVAVRGKMHRHGGRTLHLPHQFVVAGTVQPLLDQHRPWKCRRQSAQQLAHGIRAADPGEHEDGAGQLGDMAWSIDQLHRRDADVEFLKVAMETVADDVVVPCLGWRWLFVCGLRARGLLGRRNVCRHYRLRRGLTSPVTMVRHRGSQRLELLGEVADVERPKIGVTGIEGIGLEDSDVETSDVARIPVLVQVHRARRDRRHAAQHQLGLATRWQHLAGTRQFCRKVTHPARCIPAFAACCKVSLVEDHGDRRIVQQSVEAFERILDAGFQRHQDRLRPGGAHVVGVGQGRIRDHDHVRTGIAQRRLQAVTGIAGTRQQSNPRRRFSH